jgi:hypothetical protein
LYKDGSPLKRISISEIEKAELFAAWEVTLLVNFLSRQIYHKPPGNLVLNFIFQPFAW